MPMGTSCSAAPLSPARLAAILSPSGVAAPEGVYTTNEHDFRGIPYCEHCGASFVRVRPGDDECEQGCDCGFVPPHSTTRDVLLAVTRRMLGTRISRVNMAHRAPRRRVRHPYWCKCLDCDARACGEEDAADARAEGSQ